MALIKAVAQQPGLLVFLAAAAICFFGIRALNGGKWPALDEWEDLKRGER